ncbi:MAG: NADH-quinone oxidoreductase subunit L, partial [Crocinitomicaceae bacterium]
MESILPLFLAIPLLGFVLSLITPRINERAIYLMSLLSSGALALLSIFFTIWWACYHAVPINVKEITLYEAGHYSFFIDLLFDEITAVYCIISSILTFIISMYSRVYMHKDPGYKRFFNTLILFYFSVQIIIFSGNFETLFIGWEILGVSSFLLIAFYRERYMPVRNAFKVFSMYRLADIGILLTMWLSHHLWHENITFLQLENSELVHTHIQEHTYIGVIISIALVVSASIKSAQFPFSSWLPRAMEGPTPSSAIFYGSIAVHIGVFLL